MPTIPKQTVDTNSVNVLNSIRNEIGGTYKDIVPAAYAPGDIVDGREITRDRALGRLREIGQTFRIYESAQNAFLDALVNRIGLVLLTNRLYENPWRGFKKGILEYGETIEEIFVGLLDAQQFDPERAENEIFRREFADVQSAFHRMNYQKFYKVTISEPQMRAAFLSFDGVNDLITKIIEQLYTSANYDEFLMMKYLICRCILDGKFYPETIPALNTASPDDIVVALKNVSEQVTFMSTDYNEAGVATYTDKNFQYFFFNTEFLSTIDVKVLARAFNLEYTQLMGHTVSVNSFRFTPLEESRVKNLIWPNGDGPDTLFTADEAATLATVPGIMVDENWLMIFDNLAIMKTVENGQGLYWNYVYHNWKTFSHSPFNTAIAFTTAESAVTGVTVAPGTASVTKGTQAVFTATVATTGLATQGVKWSISEATDSYITASGMLYVGDNETAETIKVTATSLYDPTKSGTAIVTVQAPTYTSPEITSVK